MTIAVYLTRRSVYRSHIKQVRNRAWIESCRRIFLLLGSRLGELKGPSPRWPELKDRTPRMPSGSIRSVDGKLRERRQMGENAGPKGVLPNREWWRLLSDFATAFWGFLIALSRGPRNLEGFPLEKKCR